MKYLTIVGIAGLLAVLPAASAAQEPTVHGSKQADALEIALLTSPPLSPEEMQQTMPGMGGTGAMQGMPQMMRGMPGMGGMRGEADQPTHWIGVIVRDLKDDRMVQGLDITLTAQKGQLTRTVALMAMPGSYGANISLPEKGRYTVTVTIDRPGQPARVAFEFDSK
ncbi:MAG: hypothetical protein HYU24_10905 [Candidatus Rokubacteria bacterium]|nr:hypothetical protein [Candidatus Rokubacteria bacterium]